MRARKYRLNYVAKYNNEEGVWLPSQKTKNVEMNYVRRYKNCVYLLCQLSTCARTLMDYISEHMNDENLIRHDKIMRDEFVRFIEDITQGKVIYGHDAIKKAVLSLKEKNLIIPQARGVFLVNPEFFMKNDDTKRIDMIRMMLEFSATEEIGITVDFETSEIEDGD
jgi:hypothetical protein